jgi:hypothetical protein
MPAPEELKTQYIPKVAQVSSKHRVDLIHHKEQHGKKASALDPPPLLEAFNITNWDEV